MAQAGSGRYAYFASRAAGQRHPRGDRRRGPQEDDPTAPFAEYADGKSDEFRAVRRLDCRPGKNELAVANEHGGARGGGIVLRVQRPRSASVRVQLPCRNDPCRRRAPTRRPRLPATRARPNGRSARRSISRRRSSSSRRRLKDVVDYLKDLHHIEIQLDSAALKEAGVDESTPVTKNLKGISLRSALKLMLDELQLKYVIHNEVLLITSPAKAESDEYMITKAYPVEDLVVARIATAPCRDVQPLKDLLTNTVATKTWRENGGTGTLSEMIVGNRVLLVLSQTQEVHEQIEELLEMLRKAGGLKTAGQDAGSRRAADGELPAPARRGDLRIRRPAPAARGRHGRHGRHGWWDGRWAWGAACAAAGRPQVISVIPTRAAGRPGGDADLLEGLKSSNAANQKAKVLHLKQRQDAGQNGSGGMGGGMLRKGGVGGGMFNEGRAEFVARHLAGPPIARKELRQRCS